MPEEKFPRVREESTRGIDGCGLYLEPAKVRTDEKKPEDTTEKKPYVNPINNLTQEQWEKAMRKGIEDSDAQAASEQRDLEIYRKNKEEEKAP
jgi:hypothetical protein